MQAISQQCYALNMHEPALDEAPMQLPEYITS